MFISSVSIGNAIYLDKIIIFRFISANFSDNNIGGIGFEWQNELVGSTKFMSQRIISINQEI